MMKTIADPLGLLKEQLELLSVAKGLKEVEMPDATEGECFVAAAVAITMIRHDSTSQIELQRLVEAKIKRCSCQN